MRAATAISEIMIKPLWSLAGLLVAFGGPSPRSPLPERVVPNDNRTPAGILRNGILNVQLEARDGLWYPDGDAGPSIVLQMFAESDDGRKTRGL